MGFFAAAKSVFEAVKTKTFQFFGWEVGSGGVGLTEDCRPDSYSAGRWLKLYKNMTDFKQPVQRLAQDVAAVRFWLGRVVGQSTDGTLLLTRVHAHPFLELWQNPNYLMSLDQFLELGMTWLETTGRWATYIERGARGLPVALWPIAPTDLLRMPTKSRPKWRFKLNGKPQEANPSDVIWIHYIDPERPYGPGASPAQSIAVELDLIGYANKWNLNHFRNGAHVGKVIGVPGLNNQTGPKMQADFDARFKGVENAHKSFFVGTGTDATGKVNPNVSVIDLGRSHVEMDYSGQLDSLSDKVAANWSIPRSILGRKGNANRSEGDNDVKFYQRQAIAPRAEFLRQKFQMQLVAEFGEPDLWLGFEDPVEESKQFLLEQSNAGVSRGTITVNEWRSSQGKDALGPIGEVLLIPVNTAVAPKDLTAEELALLLERHSGGAAGGSSGGPPTSI